MKFVADKTKAQVGVGPSINLCRGADCLVGVVLAMVWGPEGVVAQLGGPAVMIRGGSRRVRCHSVRRRLGGCR